MLPFPTPHNSLFPKVFLLYIFNQQDSNSGLCTKMTTPPTSYDWIRTIDPELKALDTIPLTGAAPSFPWADLSSRLARSFDREGFSIQPKDIMWRTTDQLYDGLGDSPFPLIFAVPILKGDVCWVMPEQEMVLLETWLLTKESHPISFQDRALSESFYRFFALEVLYHLSQTSFDKSIAPILTNKTVLPQEDALCLDISLSMHDQTLWGRLIISPDLRHSWVEHYASHGPSPLTQQMAQAVEVQVHLEAGKTQLSLAEWSAVSLGDFIVLDSCSLDADGSAGRVMLTVNGKAAHRGKIKDGNLKILELPLIQEVNPPPLQALNTPQEVPPPMAKHEDEDEDDLSDLDFTEDEELEDEESFDESLLNDEEEEKLSPPPAKPVKPEPSKVETSAKPVSETPYTPEHIPVALTVEVGRIQMTMENLLRLEPGNMLELNVHPEDGVDLTINGKLVGRGELLRIGENLGVRVLELGR